MPHADNILAHLDAQGCVVCGGRAVRGARICIACAELQAKEDNMPGIIGSIGPAPVDPEPDRSGPDAEGQQVTELPPEQTAPNE